MLVSTRWPAIDKGLLTTKGAKTRSWINEKTDKPSFWRLAGCIIGLTRLRGLLAA
jgi:hypothetical protein